MSKRRVFVSSFIVLLLAVLSVPACSGDDTASGDGDVDSSESSPDGDAVSDGDGDTESIDPCAELQCEPGGECLKRKNNVPYCFCGSGYHTNSDFTECLPDETDGDGDRDIDWDYDTTACNPASTPWPSLPCCNTDGSGPRPCIIDLEFEYTNDIGEFTLGFRDAKVLDSFDLSGDKIALIQWMSEGNPKNGIKFFDYKTKSGVLIDDCNTKLHDHLCVGSEKAYFTERDHYIVDTESMIIPANYLYEIDLSDMQSRLVENTDSYKEALSCNGDRFIWLDNRLDLETYNKHLYGMQDNGETERLDLLSDAPATEFDVYGNSMLYSIGYSAMVLKSFETGTETLLTDEAQYVLYPRISEKYATWYDLSASSNPSSGCGKSLILYDREKEKADYFKKSSGLDDHGALDLWSDWMLYYECHGGRAIHEFCCDDLADGDIYIYHFPTQKSWKLTDSPGARWDAKMYDHLIVWRDGRMNPDDRTMAFDLYGMDLCLHPELKDYFESCKDGGAEKK